MPISALLRRLAPLWLAALLAGACPVTASAGQYEVFLCKTPDPVRFVSTGAVAGWYVPQGYVTASDTCASGGSAGVGFGSLQRAVGEFSRLTLTVPDTVSIAAATVKRRVQVLPGSGDWNGSPEWTIYRDEPTYDAQHILDACSPFGGCNSRDWPSGSDIGWTFSPPTRTLIWEVHCGGNAGGYCGGTGGQDRIYGDILQMRLTMNDGSLPSGTASGPATQLNISHAGTEQANLTATDSGSGVFQATALLDSTVAGQVGSGCSDAGHAAGNDFEQITPCPGSVDPWALPVNTKVVANGQHRLRIVISDAAGNDRTVYDQIVTIANPVAPTPATPTPKPVAAGSATPAPLAAVATPTPTPPATPGPGSPLQLPVAVPGSPKGTIALVGRKSQRTTASRGRKLALKLRVLGAGGEPLPGVAVGVEERIQRTGADDWAVVGQVATDPDGLAVYEPRTTASRELRFTYAYDGGSFVLPFTVAVRARMSVRAARTVVGRRGTLRLSGRVQIDELPRRGTYVDVQVRTGKGWQTVDTRRTDGAGRWTWRYTFRRSRPATFTFRARLRRYADVAAAPSSSRKLAIRVR